MPEPTYTDDALTAAVATSRSWRGVLRAVGKPSTSAGSLRSARRRAEALGLDYSHFTGQRRWSDAALSRAVAAGRTWQDVVRDLGLSASSASTVQAHAVRLGLDTAHLRNLRPEATRRSPELVYDASNLRSAGSLFAATWFALRGASVSWPLEPCRYDLLVDTSGVLQRVQVKTTTGTGAGADVVVANSRRHGAAVYAPGEIDSFFIVDGELTAYLIPYEVVAGYRALRLGHYVTFKIVDRGALLSGCASP